MLLGSCALEYTLEYTDVGKIRYNVSSNNGIFAVICCVLLGFFFVIYRLSRRSGGGLNSLGHETRERRDSNSSSQRDSTGSLKGERRDSASRRGSASSGQRASRYAKKRFVTRPNTKGQIFA